MRLIRIAAALLPLVAAPALAGAPATSAMHADTSSMCRSECLATAALPGAPAGDAAQACTASCAGTGLSRAAGRGSAEATAPAATPALSRPARTAAERRPAAGRPANPRIIPVAARPAAPPAPAPTTHGAIYVARAPSWAFGLVVGDTDRVSAHHAAERECASGGTGCRMVVEFTATCGAAVMGIQRSQWASFVANDPESVVVTSVSGGAGATQARAERQAVEDCRARDPQAECLVVASICGGGRTD